MRGGGNNHLSAERVEMIRTLSMQGVTVRGIQRATGIHTQTIINHQKALGVHGIHCPCGQPLKHRGYCRLRYQASTARQAFMARWHGRAVTQSDGIDRVYLGTEEASA